MESFKLLITFFLISRSNVRCAEDFYDRAADPPYELYDKSEAPDVLYAPDGQVQVVPLVIVTVAPAPIAPRAGPVLPPGVPIEIGQAYDAQLREEESIFAGDQLDESLEPMLHNDRSLAGRGYRVGYYQEVSVVDPRAINGSDSSTTAAPSKGKSLVGILVMTLVLAMLITVAAMLCYIFWRKRRQRLAQEQEIQEIVLQPIQPTSSVLTPVPTSPAATVRPMRAASAPGPACPPGSTPVTQTTRYSIAADPPANTGNVQEYFLPYQERQPPQLETQGRQFDATPGTKTVTTFKSA